MNRVANVDSLSALIDRLIIETIKQTHLIHQKKTTSDPAKYAAIDKAQMAVNETRAALKNRIDELLTSAVGAERYGVVAEQRTL